MEEKGGYKSPPFHYRMDLKEQLTALVESKVEGTGSFIVEVRVTPSKIFVFIDNLKGIQLEECISMNRFLQEKLEETDVFEHHELEVSSPGMDETLKVLKQYLKRIGQKVTVLMKDGIRKEGVLKAATEVEIVIEEKTIKKVNGKRELHTELTSIPLDVIKETRLLWEMKSLR